MIFSTVKKRTKTIPDASPVLPRASRPKGSGGSAFGKQTAAPPQSYEELKAASRPPYVSYRFDTPWDRDAKAYLSTVGGRSSREWLERGGFRLDCDHRGDTTLTERVATKVMRLGDPLQRAIQHMDDLASYRAVDQSHWTRMFSSSVKPGNLVVLDMESYSGSVPGFFDFSRPIFTSEVISTLRFIDLDYRSTEERIMAELMDRMRDKLQDFIVHLGGTTQKYLEDYAKKMDINPWPFYDRPPENYFSGDRHDETRASVPVPEVQGLAEAPDSDTPEPPEHHGRADP